MDNLIIILLIALVIGNIAIFIVQLKNKPKEDNNNVEEKFPIFGITFIVQFWTILFYFIPNIFMIFFKV